MTITEPATLLTDYLLCLLTTYFALKVWSAQKESGHLPQRLWAAAFAMFALAALLGGSWHGFHTGLPPLVSQLIWRATTGVIGLAGLLLVIGALYAATDNPWRARLVRIFIAKFLLYLLVVNLYDSYAVVIADYAPDLLAVLIISLIRLKSARFAIWSIAGILVAFVAAGVQVSGVSLHEHFNQNDLYHVIQAVSFWLLYRAGLLLPFKRGALPSPSV